MHLNNTSEVEPKAKLSYQSVLLLAFLAATAFIIRSLPYRNFIGEQGEYLFFGPDSYDHLRRVSLGITAFPHLPLFDSYYGYPVGTGLLWAPLFDYLLSLFVLCIGLGHPSQQLLHTVGFWLSPVLASVTIFFIYFTGTRLFGFKAGIAAAFICAILPGHIVYTFVSEFDHHAAEPIICLIIINALLGGDKDRSSLRQTLWLSFSLIFAILIWRGSVIFWFTACAALLIQIVADGVMGRDVSKLATLGSRSFLLSSALLAVFSLGTFTGSNSPGMKFNVISWFHVLFLAATGILLLILPIYFRKRTKKVTFVAAIAGGVIFFVVLAGGVGTELLKGITVLTGGDPWLDSIAELKSMLFPYGRLDILHSAKRLSFFYWLMPVALCIVFSRWRRGGYADVNLSLLLVWSIFFTLLPLFRERYVHLAAITVSLSGGLLCAMVAQKATARIGKYGLGVASIFLLVMLLPIIPMLLQVPVTTLPEEEKYDLMPALRWLRDRTPRTSYFSNPVIRPEYGVLANWDLGAYVDYYAQRPVLGTNFGWETYGLFQTTAFLTTSDLDVAEKIADENGIRYVLLKPPIGGIDRFRAIAELGVRRGELPPERLSPYTPQQSVYYTLALHGGSGYEIDGYKISAMERYRLVYQASGGLNWPGIGKIPHYRIFERVVGAVLKVNGRAGDAVDLILRLRMPDNKIFTYRNFGKFGKEGICQFRVPYATDGSGEFKAIGPYLLMTQESRFVAHVSATDIETSNSIVVSMGKAKRDAVD